MSRTVVARSAIGITVLSATRSQTYGRDCWLEARNRCCGLLMFLLCSGIPMGCRCALFSAISQISRIRPSATQSSWLPRQHSKNVGMSNPGASTLVDLDSQLPPNLPLLLFLPLPHRPVFPFVNADNKQIIRLMMTLNF